MLFILIMTLLSVTAFAETKPVTVFVALSEVTTVHGKGTSEQLNHLVNHYGSSTGALKSTLNSRGSVVSSIDTYNMDNVRFLEVNTGKPSMTAPTQCDYINDALGCGVKNGHWTLMTYVYVGAKYATITCKLYDERGREVAKGTKTANGKIRWIPQWKLTKIKETGGFGGGKETEIFELYPPKMEELPPLITPYHVHQAVLLTYVSVVR